MADLEAVRNSYRSGIMVNGGGGPRRRVLDARCVAGEPIAADVMKCQLKPIDISSYTVQFTAGESARLKQIFPGGVCDWSKPSMGQGVPGQWLASDGKRAGAGTR